MIVNVIKKLFKINFNRNITKFLRGSFHIMSDFVSNKDVVLG